MDGISTVSVVAVAAQAFICIFFPIFALVFWRKKTRVSVKPAFMAAGLFFLFVFILETTLAYFTLGLDSAVKEFINGSVWIKAAYGGLVAGVFEETSRLLGFRLLTKKGTVPHRRTAVTYGIGHGGFEMLMLVGFSSLSSLLMYFVIKSIGPDVFLTYMQGNGDMLNDMIKLFTSLSPSYCFWSVFERLCAFAMQVSLSVMVFAALRNKKKRWLFPAAILLHAVVDFPVGLYQAGMIRNVAVIELIIAALTCLTVFIGRRVYKGILEPVINAPTNISEVTE